MPFGRDGCPTHYETFDPKPDAPKEIRGEFEPVKTKVPGALFSRHLKRLAAIADRFAVVRSIRHDQGNHGAGNHYTPSWASTPPRCCNRRRAGRRTWSATRRRSAS